MSGMTESQKEIILAKADLCCRQGRLEKAQEYYLNVRHGGGDNATISSKLAAIGAHRQNETEAMTFYRIAWYTLGMDKADRRNFYWVGVSVIMVGACIFQFNLMFRIFKLGPFASVSSKISGAEASYQYARPIWADFLIVFIAMFVCIVITSVLFHAKRMSIEWNKLAEISVGEN